MAHHSGCHNAFGVKQVLLFLHCKMWICQLILSEITSGCRSSPSLNGETLFGSITVCCLVQKAIHRYYCMHESCHEEDKYVSSYLYT